VSDIIEPAADFVHHLSVTTSRK